MCPPLVKHQRAEKTQHSTYMLQLLKSTAAFNAFHLGKDRQQGTANKTIKTPQIC